MALLPLITLGASALGSVFQGIQQRRQARQLERQNVRPTYSPNANILRNQTLALQNSRVGLPDQVYNNQLGQIQQNLSTGLRNLGSRGANAYNTNQIVRGSNQAVGNLNAQDAQARQQNLNQLYNQNVNVANEERQAFNINQLQPWQYNAQNVVSARRAGTQNIFGGLSLLAQGAMSGAFNGVNFGGGQGQQVTPPAQSLGVGVNGGNFNNIYTPSQLPMRNFSF